MKNYQDMSNEEIKKQLEWSDHHEFSYGYSMWAFEEIERLNNIIKPKEVNYNYLKLLFEKKDKEEVIKSYVYKCEQLEKLYKSYEEKEIEAIKKDNIINKAIEYVKRELLQEQVEYYKNNKYNVTISGKDIMAYEIIDLLNILEGSDTNIKGSDENEKVNL